MVELICAHCGGTLSIAEEKVVFDEACAQLVQTLICPYCGSRYAMGDELRLASSVIITQQMEIVSVEGEAVGLSLSGGAESEVKIDQQFEVGIVHGRLVGIQIDDHKSGDVRIKQEVDILNGVMVGVVAGQIGRPLEMAESSAPVETVVNKTKTDEAAQRVNSSVSQDIGENQGGAVIETVDVPAGSNIHIGLPDQVEEWTISGEATFEPVMEQPGAFSIQPKKKTWWQFWK